MEKYSLDSYIVKKLLAKNHLKDDVPVEIRLAPLNFESVYLELEYRPIIPKQKNVVIKILRCIRSVVNSKIKI